MRKQITKNTMKNLRRVNKIIVIYLRRSALDTRGFSRVVWTRVAKNAKTRAGHNRDIADTGNRARKTSGTHATLHLRVHDVFTPIIE